MFKNRSSEDLNVSSLNELINLGKRILKIIYFLIIIIGFYAVIILLKELKILEVIFTIASILAPFFIGLVIAWLFEPFVRWLKTKGIGRGFGAAITYIILIGIVILLISSIIPIFSEQINDFAKSLPSVFETVERWLSNIFEKLSQIDGFDALSFKNELLKNLETYANNLTTTLPEVTVNVIKGFFSGLGVFVVGLVIGFYLLLSFENFSDSFVNFIPKRFRNEAMDFSNEINVSLRKFVQGTILLSTLIFITNLIGFGLAGLKGALLFALFCGITNIIPIVGPYIGGIPAIIVAFSQDVTTGIFVLIIIFIVQFLEGNFFQPILMSKTMKLHPVTIIVGLLIFGYYWGILGMILATPVISIAKALFMFFDDKFNLLNFEE